MALVYVKHRLKHQLISVNATWQTEPYANAEGSFNKPQNIYILNAMFSNIDILIISYIAGFLDRDGCINVQIVRRSDYV